MFKTLMIIAYTGTAISTQVVTEDECKMAKKNISSSLFNQKTIDCINMEKANANR